MAERKKRLEVRLVTAPFRRFCNTTDCAGGYFLFGRNKYAKTYKVTDINYAVASWQDKEAMFLDYSELLNSLDSGATTKITIVLGG